MQDFSPPPLFWHPSGNRRCQFEGGTKLWLCAEIEAARRSHVQRYDAFGVLNTLRFFWGRARVVGFEVISGATLWVCSERERARRSPRQRAALQKEEKTKSSLVPPVPDASMRRW